MDHVLKETASRTGDAPSRPARPLWKRLWPLALVAAAAVAFYLSGLTQYLSVSALIREHEALAALVEKNALVTAAGYVAVYVLAVAASFPGASILTIIGGYLFGAIPSTLLTVVAATAGATAIFQAARSSLGEVLRARVGRFGDRLARGFEEDAFYYLLFLRLLPIFPFWLINIAPAIFHVRLRTYVLATALGIIPGTLAYSLLGSGFGDLIREITAKDPGCAAAGTCAISIDALLTPGPLLAMTALTLAAVVPLIVKRVRAARAA